MRTLIDDPTTLHVAPIRNEDIGYTWTSTHQATDADTGEQVQMRNKWRTDRHGFGLWLNERQVIGTAQGFCLTSSASTRRRRAVQYTRYHLGLEIPGEHD